MAPSGAIATRAAWPTRLVRPSALSRRATTSSAMPCKLRSSVERSVKSWDSDATKRFTSALSMSTK
jgi:hypothetical protein